MGKNGFLTPKDVANKMKAKGLQKLRWYCQMCQKQCRDENGFKCHLTSDSHKRQMEIFGQNPQRIIEGYSEEFESAFLDHMRVSHPFSRVAANHVYNEFIREKSHIHMNSTKWLTLSEFVKYLGRTGKCKVEDTEKGWFITLIQRDPFEELGEKKRVKRERAEREEEERHRRLLEEQIAKAQKMARTDEGDAFPSDQDQQEQQGPLGFSLAASSRGGGQDKGAAAAASGAPTTAFIDDADGGPSDRGHAGGHQHKKSKVEELMERELKSKQQQQRNQAPPPPPPPPPPSVRSSPSWLAPSIIVKVMSKALKQHGYYKQKGVVLRVIDTYLGEIEMLDSGDVLRVDQAELETVIPQAGGRVLVVVGGYQGQRGTLLGMDQDKYRAEVELESGKTAWFEYEDISKLSK